MPIPEDLHESSEYYLSLDSEAAFDTYLKDLDEYTCDTCQTSVPSDVEDPDYGSDIYSDYSYVCLPCAGDVYYE